MFPSHLVWTDLKTLTQYWNVYIQFSASMKSKTSLFQTCFLPVMTQRVSTAMTMETQAREAAAAKLGLQQVL